MADACSDFRVFEAKQHSFEGGCQGGGDGTDRRDLVVGNPWAAPEERRDACFRSECDVKSSEVAEPADGQRPPDASIGAGWDVGGRQRGDFEWRDGKEAERIRVACSGTFKQGTNPRGVARRLESGGDGIAVGFVRIIGHAAQLFADRNKGNAGRKDQCFAADRRTAGQCSDELQAGCDQFLPGHAAEREVRGHLECGEADFGRRVGVADFQQWLDPLVGEGFAADFGHAWRLRRRCVSRPGVPGRRFAGGG